jgi:hypothetical protein
MQQTKVAMISKVLLVSEFNFTFLCNADAARTLHYGKVAWHQKSTTQWISILFHPERRKIFLPRTDCQTVVLYVANQNRQSYTEYLFLTKKERNISLLLTD